MLCALPKILKCRKSLESSESFKLFFKIVYSSLEGGLEFNGFTMRDRIEAAKLQRQLQTIELLALQDTSLKLRI